MSVTTPVSGKNFQPDTITLKLRRSNGNFTVKCFGNDKKAANVMDVCQKGCYVKAIIELNSVFLKKNQFSSSATAYILYACPYKQRIALCFTLHCIA